MKLKLMSMAAMALSALLCLTTTGAMAQTTYKVSVKEGTEDASNWQGKAGEGEYQTLPLEGVAAGMAVSVTYSGTKKVKSVKAKKKVDPLAVPLTMEAVTDGTVVVNNPKSGMQYSLNGGAKAPVTSEAIPVSAGDKVRFYGNGTSISNYNGTRISGGTAQVKAYGNIMSLIDETGYATLTTLLNQDNVFMQLFNGNTNLTDASGLLLPAETLAESCYYEMFKGCTSLTTAPALPAATLAGYCYRSMFQGCTNLNSVTCMATDISASDCTTGWLDGVAPTGTFTKASGATWPTGSNGIPSGWKTNATVTTAPTAKSGVKAGQNEAIVNAGTAEGGTMMYMVNATQPASTNGFSATVPTAEGLTAGTYYVWYYVKADDSHTDSEISATAIAVTVKAAAPATITVTWNNNDITGSGNSFTKDGVTITAGIIDFDAKNFMQDGTFTTTLGNFTKIEVTAFAIDQFSGTGWSGSDTKQTWTGNASSVSFSGNINGMTILPFGYINLVFTIEPTN